MRQARDPELLKRARELRRDMSPPERALWAILRAHQLAGWKFTRQVQVEPYILDFAARREKLAIELDGGQSRMAGSIRCAAHALAGTTGVESAKVHQ